MINRVYLARLFATELAEDVSTGKLARILNSARVQEEHKAIAPFLNDRVIELLRRKGFSSLTKEVLCDYEGQTKRSAPQDRSYPVLGTWTHPDAAVLRPFSCAIEIDRSGARSHFKDVLMKAAVHVLSGAYDACLLIYIYNTRSPRREYFRDGSAQTTQLLEHLSAAGMRIAFVKAQS